MVAAAFVLDVSCSLCTSQMQQGAASSSAEASGRGPDSSLFLCSPGSAATPLPRWARGREPWHRGLGFLTCQLFAWKINLQTQLSYGSEGTRPPSGGVQVPCLGVTFQGTRVPGGPVTQGTGCVMCGQIHTAPGCSNRDNPAALCACHLCPHQRSAPHPTGRQLSS